MRRRLNLAAPAVREHILSHHKDVRRRLHPDRDPEPDDYELRIMAGDPIEVHAWQLPGWPNDYGLTVHDSVRVHADGRLEVLA